jgi:hypothetical protein
MVLAGVGVETRNMTLRVKLISGLKKTRNALVGLYGQRLQTTSAQQPAGDHFYTGLEHAVSVKPYSEVPGPPQLPVVGNSWRFLPYIGKWRDF